MIKTQTVYSKKAFDDFAKFMVKNNSFVTIIVVCGGILVACAVFMAALAFWLEAVLYSLAGGVFLCYGIILRFMININNKANIGVRETFEFDEETLKIVSYDKDDKEASNATMSYKNMFKTQTNIDYGYIFVNKAMAYIIEKNNFENQKDFEEVLKRISQSIEKEKDRIRLKREADKQQKKEGSKKK